MAETCSDGKVREDNKLYLRRKYMNENKYAKVKLKSNDNKASPFQTILNRKYIRQILAYFIELSCRFYLNKF
jgi:hypothetical protein